MKILATQKALNAWINNMVRSLTTFCQSEHNRVAKEAMEVSFDNWCDPARFSDDANGVCQIFGNIIVTVTATGLTVITNVKTGKRAQAQLSPLDKFNSKYGLALAWARYTHREIPIIANPADWEDLAPGDVFLDSNDKPYMICGLNVIADMINDVDATEPCNSYTCAHVYDNMTVDLKRTITKTYGALSSVPKLDITPANLKF